MSDREATISNPIAALRRLTRPRVRREQCALCAAELGDEHSHLLEVGTHNLQCACEACVVLFSGNQNGRFRRIPRKSERWMDFQLSDEQWDALGIPISLAYFYHDTPRGHMIAAYPSPGGATEAALAQETWQLVAATNPRLAKLAPDVEALMANRLHGNRAYYRVPIDQCYKLIGLIRMQWRGLSGGKDVWQEIDRYFHELDGRCAGATSHA